MRISAFWTTTNAIGYYRLHQPMKWLQKLGLAEVKMPDINYGGRISFEKKDSKDGQLSYQEYGEWADIIFFQRVQLPLMLACVLGMRDCYKIPIVEDCDDNVFALSKKHFLYDSFKKKDVFNLYDHYYIDLNDAPKHEKVPDIICIEQVDEKRCIVIKEKRGRRHFENVFKVTDDTIKMVNAMTTTTQNLKDEFLNHNKNVYVIPNCLDYEIWDNLPEKKDNGNNVVIGWAGGAQHGEDVDIMIPAISKILKRYPQVIFKIIGCTTMKTDIIEREFPKQVIRYRRTKTLDEYPKALADWNFDIMLAPLTDIKFNHGVSHLKWLESSARKIPLIASNLPPYQEITQGKTGILVNNTLNEWERALATLIENPKLRNDIGNDSYSEVKSRFNIKDNVHLWAEAFEGIIKNFKTEDYNKKWGITEVA